jgi:secreted trypsin-like serine protease
LLALGCQGMTTDATEQQHAIIGGTPTDTAADPGIVALFAQVPGQQQGALCTAEVISPTVLLTAAHCTDEAEVGQGAVWRAYLGNDLTQQKDHPELWVDVKEVHHDSAFSTTNLQGGHDIGVAILAQPLPDSIKPLPFNRKALATADSGKAVRIVGYGLSDGFQQTGAGIKRTANTTIGQVSDTLIQVGDGTHNICNGDSGGPALLNVDGTETIVGVTSFGFIFCLGSGNDTRVDLYTDFIDQFLH